VVRGLCCYQREHLDEVGRRVKLSGTIHVTGGALNAALIRAKRAWMQNGDYLFEEESSLKGAALLGQRYLEG
jgi:hypothetical protein